MRSGVPQARQIICVVSDLCVFCPILELHGMQHYYNLETYLKKVPAPYL